ncbi:MAG TPA: copper resistance CopC family protein [Thermoleophilia bacterium]|nr:copper resistance CopC family protein [Thermoleophilia bacterium]
MRRASSGPAAFVGAYAGALAVAAVVLAGCLGFAALVSPPATAHSALARSSPAAGEALPTAPDAVVLEFTEAPEPTVLRVEIADREGRAVSGAAAPEIAPDDPRTVRVRLDDTLPEGVYSVNWRVVSSVDGHVESGSFAFGVGVVPPAGAAAGGIGDVPRWLLGVQDTGRWLLYAGLVLMVGAAGTLSISFAGRVPPGGVVLLRLAWLAAAVGAFVVLLAERAIIDVPSLLPLLHTTPGKLQGYEGLLVLASAAGVAAVDLAPGRRTLAALGGLAAAAMLLHVLSGHAAAPTVMRPLNLVSQWTHLVAVGVWIGGLAWLLLGLRGEAPGARAAAVVRFSTTAAVALAVVVATGAVRAVAEVGSPSLLFTTGYGLTLTGKLVLVLGLVALGALNRFRHVPRVAARAPGAPAGARRSLCSAPLTCEGGPAIGALRRSVGGELVLAAAILALTASLSGTAPARVAAAGAPPPPAASVVAVGDDFTGTVRVRLTVTPGTAGANAFTAVVLDAASGGPREAEAVKLGFSLPTRPSLAAATLELEPGPDGTWTGEGLQLSALGEWSVEVLVQEPADAVVVPLTVVVSE